jgi:hypothetical protein
MGFVTLPEKAPKPGYPRSGQHEIDPRSLNLAAPAMPLPQLLPNPDPEITHDVVPGAPNAYDWLGQDVGGRMLQTGAPNINPFAGAIQQVGEVVDFPWQRTQRNAEKLRRVLQPTFLERMGGSRAPALPFTPTPVIQINPFRK